MGDQQQMFSGAVLIQLIDGIQYPFLERQHGFATRRCELIGCSPEPPQILGMFLHEFDGMPAFPVAKVQFPQSVLQHQRQMALLGQFKGKVGTAAQRGTDDGIPMLRAGGGLTHLLPAGRGKLIIQTAAEAAAKLGLTVAQQIQRQHWADPAATAASAKVAMSLCRAQAMRSRGTAAAAPVPSPRRMPRSSSGSAPSPCSTAA